MGNQIMKNYPIIKSNEAVTVLFTAPRHGYVLDYNDDHYAPILYKSDWNEGAFSEVGKSWFKGKCIVVDSDSERDFVRELIFNISGVLFAEPSVSNAKVFYVENCRWCHTEFKYDQTLEVLKQLHIPFNEIFENDIKKFRKKLDRNSVSGAVKFNEFNDLKYLESIIEGWSRMGFYEDSEKFQVILSRVKARLAALDVWKNYEKRIEAAIGADHQNGAIGFAADFIELANELLPAEQPILDQFKQVITDLNDKVRVIEEIKSILPDRDTNIPVVDRVRTLVGGDTGKISDLAQALDTIGFKYTCPVQAATEFIKTLIRHGMAMPMKPEFTKQQYLDAGWTEQQLIEYSIVVKPEPNTPKYDYKYIVNHVLELLNSVEGVEVNIGNLYDTLNNLLIETVVAKPKMNIMVSDTNVYESSNLKLNLLIDDNLSFYIDPNTSTLSVRPKESVNGLLRDKRTLNEIIQLLDGTNNTTVETSNVYETVKNVFTQWEMFGIAKPASKTPLIEWKETHEVKIGDTWFQVNPVFVSEVEMFFYDPRPTPPAMAPTNSVRQSNLSVINLNSPDYRNNEIGYLCIDDDGVLHPYDPESSMAEVKLCKNIL